MAIRRGAATLLAATALMTGIGSASASVVITGTRVVYPESEPEVTVRVTNDGNAPALVQAWLDDGDPKTLPNDSKAPFAIVPPLFRLDPKKGQSLRIMYTHEPLPADKESLYWLNVLQVPPRDAAKGGVPNQLHLVFRTRIKLFFRPAGLSGDIHDAAAALQWKFVHKGDRYVLEASNPSSYHVTLNRIESKAGGASWTNSEGGMIAPHASTEFDMGAIRSMPAGPLEVGYTYINDYGAGVAGTFREKKN